MREIAGAVRDPSFVRLKAQIAGARVLQRAQALRALLGKAGFRPDQPRVPRGRPDAGKWTKEPGSAGPEPIDEPPTLDLPRRGIGDNGGPPLEEPPEIPLERPPTIQLRNILVRALARWLLRALLREAFGPIGLAITVIEAAHWIHEYYPYIQAYLDEPKTLDELRRAVRTPKKGYEVHHIVEQAPAEQDGFPRSKIDAPENLVRISKFKHEEITAWYGRKNPNYDFMSPRDYLRGKTWEERRLVGLDAMIKYEVLAP